MKQSLEYIKDLLSLPDLKTLEDSMIHLGIMVGKDPKNILCGLIDENEDKFNRRKALLGHPRGKLAEPIYSSLLREVGKIEEEVKNFLKGSEKLLDLCFEETPYKHGLFLKTDVAAELLKKHPPPNILEHLGYPGVGTMLEREDIFEIFSALRFSENQEWMIQMIDLYRDLKPEHFEEREVRVIKMDGKKWKCHNLSHSKEMGVIFLIPTPDQFDGLNLQAMALIFHYFAELYFYSCLLARASDDPESFGSHLSVAIAGDIPGSKRVRKRTGECWYILQRYLEKDPRKDFRFFTTHISPEAVHWARAFKTLGRFAKQHNLTNLYNFNGAGDWVAKRLSWGGEDIIVTLNLEDLIFSYAKQLPVESSFVYHWRESFWNKLFSSFVGEKEMIGLMERELYKGVLLFLVFFSVFC